MGQWDLKAFGFGYLFLLLLIRLPNNTKGDITCGDTDTFYGPDKTCIWQGSNGTWDETRLSCYEKNGDLVMVKTDDKVKFVENEIRTWNTNQLFFWMGLRRDKSSTANQWVWVDHTIQKDLFTVLKEGQNCSGILLRSGRMYDRCDVMTYGICERGALRSAHAKMNTTGFKVFSFLALVFGGISAVLILGFLVHSTKRRSVRTSFSLQQRRRSLKQHARLRSVRESVERVEVVEPDQEDRSDSV